jgi:hypothetical protein
MLNQPFPQGGNFENISMSLHPFDEIQPSTTGQAIFCIAVVRPDGKCSFTVFPDLNIERNLGRNELENKN